MKGPRRRSPLSASANPPTRFARMERRVAGSPRPPRPHTSALAPIRLVRMERKVDSYQRPPTCNLAALRSLSPERELLLVDLPRKVVHNLVRVVVADRANRQFPTESRKPAVASPHRMLESPLRAAGDQRGRYIRSRTGLELNSLGRSCVLAQSQAVLFPEGRKRGENRRARDSARTAGRPCSPRMAELICRVLAARLVARFEGHDLRS